MEGAVGSDAGALVVMGIEVVMGAAGAMVDIGAATELMDGAE